MIKVCLALLVVLLALTPAQAVSDAAQPPAGAGLLGGAFRYFADAAVFKDCRTGKGVPVASDGAFLELQAAYAAQRSAPAAPLYVTVEGGIEEREGMEGPPRPTLVVKRFLAAWPGMTCVRGARNAPLVGTDWKIVVLKGETLPPVKGAKLASLALRIGKHREASATAGCNQLAGSFEATEGGGLTFGPFATTMMACPPPLDAREQALADVLGHTRQYGIAGRVLVLFDDRREPLAVLHGVPAR